VSKNRQLVIPAIAVGVVLIVIAIVYWVDTADALPSFFPGHEAGSSHHHFKHGLAAFILGIGAFVFAWFQTGPAPTRGARP
jgi:amino acid transporter